MKRLFYLSVGIAAGAYTSYRLSRVAYAWTPAGIAGNAAGIGASVREIADEIRVSAAEREAELRRVAGLDKLDDKLDALPAADPGVPQMYLDAHNGTDTRTSR